MKPLAIFALLAGVSACGSTQTSGPNAAFDSTSPVEFAYGTTEGGEFTSDGTRGRATAVLFIASYDLASQLVAKRLDDVLHQHVPRANAGAVALETPEYAVMADTFRTSLHLGYPMAMADPPTLSGSGPFGKIASIPTLVVLDSDGREVWRKAGALSSKEIEQALALGSRHGSAPAR